MKRFAVAALLAASPVVAPAQGKPVNIFGFDDATCTAWEKSRDNKYIRAQYEFWIRGFVSGHNWANPGRQVQVGALPGGDPLYDYIDRYCRENPTQTFIGAALLLTQELREPPAFAKKPAAKPPVK